MLGGVWVDHGGMPPKRGQNRYPIITQNIYKYWGEGKQTNFISPQQPKQAGGYTLFQF